MGIFDSIFNKKNKNENLGGRPGGLELDPFNNSFSSNVVKPNKPDDEHDNNSNKHKTTTTTTLNKTTSTTTSTTSTTTIKKDKVLFILKENYYFEGYSQSYGLGNSARMIAEYLQEELGVESKVVSVIDANGIDSEVHKYNPTIVIIEALWITAEKLNTLNDKYYGIKWIVRIHSNAAFLATESSALKHVHDYIDLNNPNLILSCNNKEFNDEMSKTLYHPFEYLPNIIDLNDDDDDEHNHKHHHGHHHSNIIKIGSFGALRVLKNQLFQAMCAIDAADKLKKTLHFHINMDTEYIDTPVLKNIQELFKINNRHELYVHEWMEHDDFIELINEMDIGLQVSFTESFNLITADFVNEGIPVLVGESITWMPYEAMVSTINFENVAKKIVHIYNSDNKNLIRRCKRALIHFNEDSKKVWHKFILH